MPFETGNPHIDQLDLSPMIAKLSTPGDPLTYSSGWSRQQAEKVAELYRSFLFLIWKYPGEKLVPTREIDEFWHTHILFTERYHSDCERIFGRYVHHYPHDRSDPESARLDRERFARTLELVAREFPSLVG